MVGFSERISKLSPKRLALLAMDLQSRLEAVEQKTKEPIAIIGVGCRFPGGASSPAAFWRLLHDGVDAISEVPGDRWDIETYYDPDPDAPGKMYAIHGGFIDGIDQFDPHFFGISPREAVTMDPQQRLLLEVAWEALENAGQAPEMLEGSSVGVFIGICSTDYSQLLLRLDPDLFDAYLATGSSHAIASGRLSYILGLHGPSVSIDTACSSSLVAVHMACLSLRAGECRQALAGGVNLLLTPYTTIALCKTRMLAPDGRCKTFDARADGFGRGEGCGMVVLKRFSDAVADGDNILAVIAGSAVNQDGRSSGITAPNGPAQEAVIRQALGSGGIEPSQVGYVETHGTGTSLGDPIEVNALNAVYGKGRAPDNRLGIGSVKTNFGHTEGAAGVAGLIKVVLSLQHKHIPPHLHLDEPNPHIAWNELPVHIPTTLTPWPVIQGRRIGAVSSFGFSGTNAHVIVAEAPEVEREENGKRQVHILCLSAKSEGALTDLARQYERYLKPHPDASLADICFTANAGRSHFLHRLALIAESQTGMRDRLTSFLSGDAAALAISRQIDNRKRPDIVFLFTGQGSQYVGMGRTLYETHSTFRKALDTCDELLRSRLEKPLLSVLYPQSGETSALDQTAYTQPALFSLEYALAELWRSWGIEPTAVMGHSLGEYVAACVAGVFSLDDALRLVSERGRLMQSLPQEGRMVAVFADELRVAAELAPYRNEVAIAAINGPENTVISGASGAIEEIVRRLEGEGIRSRELNVSHAFHSPLMEPILARFEKTAATVAFASPRVALISNLTGSLAEKDAVTQAGYWRRHLREPVRFLSSIATLYDGGYRVFVEIGPSPLLLGMARRCLREDRGVWLPSLRRGRDDWQQMLQTLAELYVHNVKIDWQGFDRDYGRRRVSLPTYPFQRQRYWFGTREPKRPQPTDLAQAEDGVLRKAGHPLLGNRIRGPFHTFETQVSRGSLAMLAEHRAHGVAVLPGAVYLEMALGAAREAYGDGAHSVDDLVIQEAMVLPEEGARIVQLMLTPEGKEKAAFQLFSTDTDGEAAKATWRLHAVGRVSSGRAFGYADDPAQEQLEPEAVKARCSGGSIGALRERLRRRGIEVGSHDQLLEEFWRRDGEALGLVRMNERVRAEAASYQLHPALLDASLQLLETALPAGEGEIPEDITYMLVGVSHLQLLRGPGSPLWIHALLRTDAGSSEGTVSGQVHLFDDSHRLVARLEGLQFRRATAEQVSVAGWGPLKDWLYEVEWRAMPWKAQDSVGLTADYIPALPSVARQVQDLVPRLCAENNLKLYDEFLPRIDALCTAYVLQAGRKLGWEMRHGQRLAASKLIKDLGIRERHRRLVERMLAMLQEDGLLEKVAHEWEVRVEPELEDTRQVTAALLREYPAFSGELAMLSRCGASLAEVLSGQADPLDTLFPGGSLEFAEKVYQEAPAYKTFNSLVQGAVQGALHRLPASRTVRVIEIGAGTGGTTSYVLPVLPGDRTEYVFTDIGRLFTTRAAQKFRDYPFVKYEILDISVDPEEQGFAAHHFDLVIAANVLHATRDLRESLKNVHKLLTPGGLLVLLEGTMPQRFGDLTVGLTEGWWNFADTHLRASYALISERKWLELLNEVGFTQAVALPEGPERMGILSTQAVILARSPALEAHTPASRQAEFASLTEAGTWIVLADNTGVGAALCRLLQGRGQKSISVTPGERYEILADGHIQIDPESPQDFVRLFREIRWSDLPPCRGIVHLWALETPPFEETSIEVLRASQRQGCGSVLCLLQAISRSQGIGSPRLWLVTRKAQPVVPQSHDLAVSQSSLWGLGTVIAMEHPELGCVRVDLDGSNPETAAGNLLTEICSGSPEKQVGFRGGVRYVPRLVRSRTGYGEGEPLGSNIRPDGTYVITGGLGGLGLLIAKWLVEQGARHLVLLGRSGPTEEARKTIDQLELLGARFATYRGDVADEKRIAGIFAEIDGTMPRLRGIIHCAGVLDDGVLIHQDWQRFAKVMAAKVDGSWVLHRLTRDKELDFFVLFSSGASLLGSAGQGNHAAANAFMDSLAHCRRARGLPALSINWGAWSETGSAARHSHSDRITMHGTSTIAPRQGLHIFGRLVKRSPAQIGVLPVNWSDVLHQSAEQGYPPFLADLAQTERFEDQAGKAKAEPATLVNELKAVSPRKRLNTLQRHIREHAARVLGVDLSSIPISVQQPLSELGLDSLMAVELRNVLASAVGRTLPATLLFDHPTIEGLASYLARDVLALSTRTDTDDDLQSVDAVSAERDWEASLDALSEDELATLLDEKLDAF
jgi:acyl transferase domain-containing protein